MGALVHLQPPAGTLTTSGQERALTQLRRAKLALRKNQSLISTLYGHQAWLELLVGELEKELEGDKS